MDKNLIEAFAKAQNMSPEDYMSKNNITLSEESENKKVNRNVFGLDFDNPTSWGEKVAGEFLEDIGLRNNPENPFPIPTLFDSPAVKKQKEDFENKRKSKEGYKSDKESFMNELFKSYNSENTLENVLKSEYYEAAKGEDETLQNRVIGKGGLPVRNPEKHLKSYIHDKIKGFGWINNGERTVNPATGQPFYPNLTNSDIDGMIDGMFDIQFEQEKKNTKNGYISLGIGGDDESRNNDINGYVGVDLKVAEIVEEINHGGLDKDEVADRYEKIKELKDSQTGFNDKSSSNMLFNYDSGRIIIPKDDEHLIKLLTQKNIVPLDNNIDEYKGLTIEELALEYKNSSLAMGGLNKKLNEVRTWEVDNPAYRSLVGKDVITEGSQMPKRISVTHSVRSFLSKNYDNVKGRNGQTSEEWDQEKERLKDDALEYTSRHESLKSMYLLNDGLLNIDKSGGQTAVKSLIEPFVGRYGTRQIMGGPTRRELVDKKGEVYGDLGIAMSTEQEKYVERNWAENVNEGLFGSAKILGEFYLVGKFLKPIEYATGLTKYLSYLNSTRFRTAGGKTFSEAAIKARARVNGVKVGERATKTRPGSGYAGTHNLERIPPTIGMQAKSIGIASLMEGIKFEAISRFDTGGEDGGFATGAGFGAMGRILAPLAPFLSRKGLLDDIDFKRIPSFVGPFTKKVYTPGNLNTQMLFQSFIASPASFMVGSEAGEIMHGIVDDAFGNKQYSDFMEEHYGDYGDVGKRLISNYFIGIGFGIAGPHGSMFKGFGDFQSEVGITKVRNNARKNITEILNKDANFSYAEIGGLNDIVKVDRYGRQVTRFETAETQTRLKNSLSKKKLQELEKHQEIYSGMKGKLLQLRRAKGYLDPLQARDMVEKDMKSIVDSNKKLGIKTEIEVVDNRNLQPGQKQMMVDADVITKDGGKTKVYRFEASKYTPDVKAHEVSHDFFETQFETDALFKGEFMTKMSDIAKSFEIERIITEQEAKKLGTPNRVGRTMNLLESIKLEKFRPDSVRDNQRVTQWELFSHIAQQIGTKANYLKVKNGDGYMKLGNLIKEFGSKSGQKYNLTLESDVVRWFRDYSKNVKKGIDTRPMFKELESVIDYGATKGQRNAMIAERAKNKAERGYESKDLGAQKKTFLENQTKSLESGKETPLYSIDKHLFKNNGELKYKTLEEFKKSGEDFAQVYYKIFSGQSVFDLKIKEGMTEKGIPDQYIEDLQVNPMSEFARKVKDKLLTRLNKNFNPSKGGGSLFGYFENIAIPYEKTRVSQEYIKEGGSTTTSLDKVGEMQAPTEARVKRFETQNVLLEQIREAKAKREGVEIKTEREEGRIFSEMMGRDVSGVQSKINKATKKQNIDLDKTKPIYKTLKKWLTEVEKIERVDKKGETKLVDPTKESDVRPLGVLSKVMEIVSKEYGVPLNRLLAKQTLTDAMRTSARDYIKNKITDIRKGVFPEGETPSGIATGAANTSWGFLYNKGGRAEFAKGATASGKPTQTKRSNITDAEILEAVGINPKTGEYAKGTKFDSAIKELIKFDATIEAKQSLTSLGRNIFSDNVIGEMGAGRPQGMASKNLEKQSFNDQVNFLFESQSKGFEKMLKDNMAIYDSEKALQKTFKTYFNDFKAKGNEFNISNNDLKIIATQIQKSYQYQKITPKIIGSKAQKAIELPNSIEGINNKAGLQNKKFTIDNESDLAEAREVTRIVTKSLVEKYGDGIYQALLMRGETGGKGVGPYSNIADLILGVGKETQRFALHESSEAGVNYMSDIVNSKGKKYQQYDMGEVTGQGNKKGQINRFINSKTGEWNNKALEKAFKVGEFNKKVLRTAVDALRKAYDKGEISHHQARAWVEIHAGPMTGLIKLSASFAVKPNMSAKKMFELYPEMVKNSKTGKMESNYVLEHITPAQEMKARIYDYIINGESKKSNLDLSLRDYHTTLIPKQYDVMVNKTLQSELPSWHKPGMDVTAARYYEYNHPSDFGFGLKAFGGNNKGKVYDHHPDLSFKAKQEQARLIRQVNTELFPENYKKVFKNSLNSKNLERLGFIEGAFRKGSMKNKKSQGMSTFDFDETAGISDNFVIAKKGKETKRIASNEWPVVGEKMVKEGWKMDFSDFNKVTNGRPGPLMQKLKNQIAKYGNENVFILTARAPESQKAIYEYLKSEGATVPLKNITGLGNSTGEAKAMWMLEKFSEGYNDMYFVDDAISNVKAVKNVLDQLDIKSSVQQALQTKNLSKEFNSILEYTKGVKAYKNYSPAKAQLMGGKKRSYFGTPGSEDFAGLVTYAFSGKGKKGEAQKKWFEENLHNPYNRAWMDIHTKKQTLSNDYKAFRTEYKDRVPNLNKKILDGEYTVDNAIRVHLFDRAGFEVPGLPKADLKTLTDYVRKNNDLLAYAQGLSKITKLKEGWLKPKDYWLAENTTMDINNVVDRVYRKEAMSKFKESREEIFGKWKGGKLVSDNMNKIEALYGTKHREALENMLWRMENFTNRAYGTDATTAKWMNWVNSASSAIMFFNQKSALLQTISNVNYLNGAENNPIAAAKAFGNQPQYWKDFMRIMNSDMLVQRRAGLKINVEAAEIVERVANGKNTMGRALSVLLEKGFLPTKMADSFAISLGGATYYRNRIKMYEKQGLKSKEAESKAWEDFSMLTEKTQQSSRPDLVSQQQASGLGRPILSFANTPMQMFRRHKRRLQDIGNRRGNLAFNIGSSIYYGFVQTAIFSYLANSMFAIDEDAKDKKSVKFAETKKMRNVNTIIDSYLRGMGVGGAAFSAIKNAIVTTALETQKSNPKYEKGVIDLLNVSPPIGSKVRDLYSTGNTFKYNKRAIPKMGFKINNPAVLGVAKTVTALTNAPVDRMVELALNIKDASNSDYENWQRIWRFLGINRYDLGIEDKEVKRANRKGGPGMFKMKKMKKMKKL